DNNEKIKMMLNNDMIAYQSLADRNGWVVNIIDYNNSSSLRKRAEELGAVFTILKFKNDNTHNRQSDSYPFFLKGYRSLFFFSDVIDPNYHSVNDLASNCNFEYCREITMLNCAMLVDYN
ncbi:MAG: M28 family peptidase, partial [Bacteroidia bacterium]|nr:M28 family peptidase [Bacteroidia bacterium]